MEDTKTASPPYSWVERNLRPQKKDHKEDFRDCKRTTRIPLYAIHMEGIYLNP